MEFRLLALLSLCLIISGCVEMDSPNTVSLSSPTSSRIPSPYYAQVDPWLDHSIFGVETLIGPGLLRSYDQDSFDCSEMAAYLEWMLEKHGFDSKICLAKRFGDTNMPHAWVAVDIDGRRYYVEPTAHNKGGFMFSIIKPLDGNYREYNQCDRIYEDIYELSSAAPVSEFDWWSDPSLRHNLEQAHSGDGK